MKTLLVALASIALTAPPVGFAEGLQCNGRVMSGYIVSSGAKVTAPGEWVAQGKCVYEASNGVYAGLALSQSLDNPGLSKTFGNEAIYMSGMKFDALDFGDIKVKANMFLFYWDFANTKLLDGANGDMVNPGLNLSVTRGNYRYYVQVDNYKTLGGRALPSGNGERIGMAGPIGPLSFDMYLLHHNRGTTATGTYIQGEVTTTDGYKIGGLTFRPLLRFSKPITDIPARKDVMVFGISAAKTF